MSDPTPTPGRTQPRSGPPPDEGKKPSGADKAPAAKDSDAARPAAGAAAADVGSVLRQARLRRGQTIDAVFQHTRIPKKHIEALEANNFDDFPAAVYLRGFLKIYCDHLEVDFDSLWSRVAPPPPAEEAAAAKAEPTTPASWGGAAPRKPAAAEEDESDEPRLPLAPLLVLGALLAGGGVWFLKLAHAPAPAAPPAPAKPPALIAPIHVPEKMALSIVFKNETWMRLTCDGKLRFEGRGPAGFSQEWKAASEFKLRTTDPKDLALTLDGRELPLDPASKDASGDYKITRP